MTESTHKIAPVDAKIIELYKQGARIQEIRKIVDMSRKYVSRVIDKNGIRKRTNKSKDHKSRIEIDKEEFTRLWNSGTSLKDMSSLLNVSMPTINTYVNKFELPKRRVVCRSNSISKNDIISILQKSQRPLSTSDIAMSIKVTWEICRKHLNAMFNDNLLNIDMIGKSTYWSLKM